MVQDYRRYRGGRSERAASRPYPARMDWAPASRCKAVCDVGNPVHIDSLSPSLVAFAHRRHRQEQGHQTRGRAWIPRPSHPRGGCDTTPILMIT